MDLPDDCTELLEQLRQRVTTSRVHAASTELLRLHHAIGRDTLDRQRRAGWGSKVIDRLAHDLSDAFLDQRGSSRANLHSTRATPGHHRSHRGQTGAQHPGEAEPATDDD